MALAFAKTDAIEVEWPTRLGVRRLSFTRPSAEATLPWLRLVDRVLSDATALTVQDLGVVHDALAGCLRAVDDEPCTPDEVREALRPILAMEAIGLFVRFHGELQITSAEKKALPMRSSALSTRSTGGRARAVRNGSATSDPAPSPSKAETEQRR